MKIRVIFTLCIVAFYAMAIASWNALRSPVAGATSAATLDDTVQSWVLARSVQNNFVEHLITATCVAILLLVWLVRLKTKKT